MLFGIEKPQTGSVELKTKGVTITNPYVAVENGLAYVSKDRDREAIILNASINSNIVLPSVKGLRGKLGYIRKKDETAIADKQIETMRIKCRSGRQLVKEMSGGNKQKVVFSKWIGKESDVLILDCPTRGIDVGVKADMYKLIMELKRSGKAIVMISEELLELIGISDRMIIFKDGKITKELMRSEDITEKDIIDYMI